MKKLIIFACGLIALCMPMLASAAEDDGATFTREVTLEKGGELARLLGDDIYKIESIIIKGQVNEDDFATLREGISYEGHLSVIDLSAASIDGDSIPSYGLSNGGSNLCCVILPEGLKKIGSFAFDGCSALEEINIPSTVEKFGRGCFKTCIFLGRNKPIEIPEGIETIPKEMFAECERLREVVLPSTLKTIESWAFFRTGLIHLEIPAGVTKIGDSAFAYNYDLKEVKLPDTYIEFEGDRHFHANYSLKSINLPEGLRRISNQMFGWCKVLENIVLPGSVREIGSQAFATCKKLQIFDWPASLEVIGEQGFERCEAMKRILLPETFVTLELSSLANMPGLEEIYSASPIPPTCVVTSNAHPFVNPESKVGAVSTSTDVSVYVPVGSADLYRKALGWRYFSNFIEIEDFPEAGIDDVTAAPQPVGDGAIYDLNGRRVAHPVEGSLYIFNGRKFIYREAR